jgi:hypothetical protein
MGHMCIHARLVFRLDFELVLGGTRSSVYRQGASEIWVTMHEQRPTEATPAGGNES